MTGSDWESPDICHIGLAWDKYVACQAHKSETYCLKVDGCSWAKNENNNNYFCYQS